MLDDGRLPNRQIGSVMALIVFTHGLGASEGFWGSTIDVLRGHERLVGNEIRPWGYRTSKRPGPPILRPVLQAVRGWKHQSLAEVGEELWSHLRTWSGNHAEVVLVGHSMGGLVTAAALNHGFTSGEDRDLALVAKLRGLVCIASPFAGAALAERLVQLYRPLGASQHVKDLRLESVARKQILQDFTRVVLGHEQLTFILMKAGNDAVVLPGEITNPFSLGQYLLDTLAGGHSDCIRDLGADSDNLTKLVAAIDGILGAAAAESQATQIALFPGRSVTIRRQYDERLARMEHHLDILAWGLSSFLEDYGDDLADWASKSTRRIRLLLVNPDSREGGVLCELQDKLERRRLGSTADDIETFLATVHPVEGSLEVRVSDYHPGINIFRIDSDMFFGPYLAGMVSRNAPTGIVSDGHWLYGTLLSHFEWMWERASVSSRSPDSGSK